MSQVTQCPTCGGKAKINTKEDVVSYIKVEDDEAFKKIGQLKKVMDKYKLKAEALEEELAKLKG